MNKFSKNEVRRLTTAKLFIDTGDPDEARIAQQMLEKAGYAGLDGATTNPSYFAKNPGVQERIKHGDKFTQEELFAAYKAAAQEIDKIVPGSDISVEVYADQNTKAVDMVKQARGLNNWLPSARIKLPIIEEGLIAAERLKGEMRLNMTLCFSQQQAAAVYAATLGAAEPVVISPFIGRLDDAGVNGTQLIGNILRMFKKSDGHIQVLAASFRRVENILEVIRLGVDIMTINLERFELWAKMGFILPDSGFKYEFDGKDIAYEEVDIDKDWREFDISHEVTNAGLQKFANDWNALLK